MANATESVRVLLPILKGIKIVEALLAFGGAIDEIIGNDQVTGTDVLPQ